MPKTELSDEADLALLKLVEDSHSIVAAQKRLEDRVSDLDQRLRRIEAGQVGITAALASLLDIIERRPLSDPTNH